METIEKTLENIREARKRRNFSHENRTYELGISQAAYSKLEKNETKLTLERLVKIATILETDVVALMETKSHNNVSQTKKDNSVGYYIEKVAHLQQENKEVVEKNSILYKQIIKEKDEIIKNKNEMMEVFKAQS